MNQNELELKFSLGQIVLSHRASAELTAEEVLSALARHMKGDCGDQTPDDKRINEEALLYGFQLLSVYHSCSGKKFYVLTEWDRSATTVLFPEEY